MRGGKKRKEEEVLLWSPSSYGVLKFSVDGAVRDKSGLTGIGGVLYDEKEVVLCMFSKGAGIRL